MTGAHLHLLVNHVPVLGAAFALLFLGIAVVRPDGEGWLRGGLLLLAIALAGDVAAYVSGEPAADAIVGAPRTSDAALAAHHARAAYVLATGALALVAASIVLLVRRRRRAALWARAALAAGTLVHAAALSWTALAGGAINHPELRAPGPPASEPVRADHHHDH